MAYLKESYVATFNWVPFFLGVFFFGGVGGLGGCVSTK